MRVNNCFLQYIYLHFEHFNKNKQLPI